VTRHEVEVSYDRAGEYYVCRLFDFRDEPKLFLVPGGIASSFSLRATQFAAHRDERAVAGAT
jgi:hypothetical protein